MKLAPPHNFRKKQDQTRASNPQITVMREAGERLINVVCRLERDHAHVPYLMVRWNSQPRKELDNSPLLRGESSKSRTNEVKSPPLAMDPVTRKVDSVFDRLGSQHSLTPQNAC